MKRNLILFSLFLGLFLSCSNSEAISQSRYYQRQFDERYEKRIPNYYDGEMPMSRFKTSQEEFKVVAAGPQGLLGESTHFSFFYLVFSQPVVPEKKVGNLLKHFSGVKITPEIEGTYCWIGQNTLLFYPKKNFFADGLYQVSLEDSFSSLKGAPLATKGFSFKFTPRDFNILDFWAGNRDSILNNHERIRQNLSSKDLKRLYIETLYQIPESLLKKQLEIRSGVRSLKYKLYLQDDLIEEKESAVYRIKVTDKVKEGEILQIFLNELPLDGRAVELAKPLSLNKIYLDYDYRRLFYYPDRPNISFVTLEFSTPINLKSLENRLLINKQAVPSEMLAQREERILYLGKLKDISFENELVLKKGVKDIYGRKIKKDLHYKFLSERTTPYFYSPYKRFNYLSKTDPFLQMEMGTITEGGWSLTPLNQNFDKEGTETVQLPWSLDKQHFPYNSFVDLTHFSESLKEKNSIFVGHPYINNSENRKWQEYYFQMTSMGMTLLVGKNQVLGFVVSLEDGSMVKDGEVTLLLDEKQKYVFPFTEPGVFFYSINQSSLNLQHQSFSIQVKTANDSIVYLVEPQLKEYAGEGYSFPLKKAYIVTDKKCYQDGERVKIAVGDFYSIHQPMRKNSSRWTIQLKRLQPYETEYDSIGGVISDSGFFTSEMMLPDMLPSGQYQLTYRREESVGEVIIQVRNDRFSSTLYSDRKSYISGETASIGLEWQGQRATPLPVGSEAVLSLTANPIRYDSDSLIWSDSYIGLLHPELGQKTVNRLQYSGEGGKTDFYLNTSELSSLAKGSPCRIEVSPRIMYQNRMMGGVGESFKIYPADFAIEAHLIKTKFSTAIKAGKKAILEYRLFSPLNEDESSFGTKNITVEIFSVGATNELTSVAAKSVKKSKLGVNRLSILLPKAGHYRIILRGEDSRKNLVLTEVPLHVLGNKSESAYLSFEPLSSFGKVGENAKFWINLPRGQGVKRGEQFAIVKEREGKLRYSLIPAVQGSQIIEVPIEEDDFPAINLQLLAWDSFDAGETEILGQNEYELASAITYLKVQKGESIENHLEIGGLDSLYSGETDELTLLMEDEELISGEFSLFFVKEGEWSDEVLPVIEDYLMSSIDNIDNIQLYDSRNYMDHAIVNQYDFFDLIQMDRSPFLMVDDLNWIAPFQMRANEKKKVKVQLPSVEGQYHLIVFGVWNEVPFIKKKPVQVLGYPQFDWKMPERLSVRDFSVGTIELKPLTIPNEDFVANLELSVFDNENKLYHSDSFFLSKANGWKVGLPLSAQKAGKYHFEVAIFYEQQSIKFQKQIEFFDNVAESHYKLKEINSPQKFSFKKIDKCDDFDLSVKMQMNHSVNQAWSAVEKTLVQDKDGIFMDSKISAALYWYIAGQRGEKFGVKSSISSAKARKILEDYSSIQKANGGYPLFYDKNYDSDYYTTLRMADLLESSDVSYYNYAIIWSLLQYLKYPFKGDKKEEESIYLKNYAIWILSKYEENVILMAKNSLDSGKGSLGEEALAGLAMLNAGEIFGTDVRGYLDDLLMKILHFYSPNLEQKRELRPRQGYGIQSPQGLETEAALAFLFLDKIGGKQAEATIALERMLSGDFIKLNDLDSTFILRALVVAQRKGYLSKINFPKQSERLSISLGEEKLFLLEGIPRKLISKDYKIESYQTPTKKRPYQFEISDPSLWSKSEFVWSYPIEVAPKVNYGYNISTDWYDAQGNLLKKKEFKLGEKYSCKISFSSFTDRGPFKVVVPIRFSDVFKVNTVIQVDSIKKEADVKFQHGNKEDAFIFSDFKHQFDQIIVRFEPLFEGVYPLPSVRIESLYDASLRGETGGSILLVKP